jgi:hypothetical protein
MVFERKYPIVENYTNKFGVTAPILKLSSDVWISKTKADVILRNLTIIRMFSADVGNIRDAIKKLETEAQEKNKAVVTATAQPTQ